MLVVDVFNVHEFFGRRRLTEVSAVNERLQSTEVRADARGNQRLRRKVDDLAEVVAVDAAVRPHPSAPAPFAGPAVVCTAAAATAVVGAAAEAIVAVDAAAAAVLVRGGGGRIRRVCGGADAT